MHAADQYHVGIVVEDLDAGLAELTELFGYDWCDEVDVEQPVQIATGLTTVRFRFRYSRSTPRLEVIQAQPGTLWTRVPGSGLHHVGYWSDDVGADGADLERGGYEREAAGMDDDGNLRWSFHGSAAGPRVELVSRTMEPLIAMMWSN
ncbi:MAG: VOC family protein [Nocardioidaceae bacterium]